MRYFYFPARTNNQGETVFIKLRPFIATREKKKKKKQGGGNRGCDTPDESRKSTQALGHCLAKRGPTRNDHRENRAGGGRGERLSAEPASKDTQPLNPYTQKKKRNGKRGQLLKSKAARRGTKPKGKWGKGSRGGRDFDTRTSEKLDGEFRRPGKGPHLRGGCFSK